MIRTANEEFENGINPNSSSEPLECEIKVSLQPLRINIDQVIYLNKNKRKIVICLSFRIHWYLCEISLLI
jgi:hypothetical protein